MNTPLLKSGRATFKALKTPGEFTAEFSVYGNVDLDGDRIAKAALVPALEKNPNPAVVWTHSWDVPPIGETLEAKSTDSGGEATARLFLDEHPTAKQVWAGLSAPNAPLKQFSFAFNIGESSLVEAMKGEDTPRKDGRIREIEVISDIFEWGPTLLGANPATSVLDIRKSLALARKAYDDIDGWSIYCLTAMIGWGVDFIEAEDDPEDVTTMKGILGDVLGLLSKEMAEDDAAKARIVDTIKAVAAERAKAGARHSEEDLGLIQQIHDLTHDLGIPYLSTEGVIEDDDVPNVLASAEEASRLATLKMFGLASRPTGELHS